MRICKQLIHIGLQQGAVSFPVLSARNGMSQTGGQAKPSRHVEAVGHCVREICRLVPKLRFRDRTTVMKPSDQWNLRICAPVRLSFGRHLLDAHSRHTAAWQRLSRISSGSLDRCFQRTHTLFVTVERIVSENDEGIGPQRVRGLAAGTPRRFCGGFEVRGGNSPRTKWRASSLRAQATPDEHSAKSRAGLDTEACAVAHGVRSGGRRNSLTAPATPSPPAAAPPGWRGRGPRRSPSRPPRRCPGRAAPG